MTIHEFPIPTAGSLPYGLTSGPDGAIWFTEWASNKVGRITTAGVVTEFTIPATSHGLHVIVSGPNRIGQLIVPWTAYFTIPPCRLFDTRNSEGPDAASPILAAGESRPLALDGRCGVPTSARAVSINVTVTQPGAPGNFVLFRGDLAPVPNTSNLNFPAGSTRANNGILGLDLHGGQTIKVVNYSAGPAHFILDVSGHFESSPRRSWIWTKARRRTCRGSLDTSR
ncbi:MAG: hypothetical protein IPP07_13485 [Holophagales bacterium]|nr:hypothetical protein [Holophagales bacterium]